jgi:HK97 family phage major capsid protein
MGPLVGLSAAENIRLGVADLLMALAQPQYNPSERSKAADTIGYWRSVSNAVDMLCGREVYKHGSATPDRYSLPGDLFQRGLTTQPGSTGGYLVGSNNAHFAPTLRDRGVLSKLPVHRLDGLQGNVAIPRGTTAATTLWQSHETEAATPSGVALGQLSLTPKTLICVVEFSLHLMKTMGQAANNYCLSEIVRAADAAVDAAFFVGTGGNEPVGIFTTPGITSQAGANLTWASTLGMLKVAEQSAEEGSLVWCIAPDAAKILRARERASGNGGFVLQDGSIAGYPVIVSGAVPDGGMVIAPWSSVTVANWRSAQIEITPFASSANFNAGITAARLIIETDFVVHQPAQIAISTSIT